MMFFLEVISVLVHWLLINKHRANDALLQVKIYIQGE